MTPKARNRDQAMRLETNSEEAMAFRPMTRSMRSRVILFLLAGLLACGLVRGADVDAPAQLSQTTPAAPEDSAVVDVPPADETPDQARRRVLTADHGAEIADAILAGTVIKEMTMDQVLESRGAPARKEVIPPDAELWHYPAGEVAFSEGKVSYVSLAAEPEPPPRPTPPMTTEPQRGIDDNDPKRFEHSQTAQADTPSLRVGDTYVYESRDPDNPEASLTTRRTVTSTDGHVVLSSLSLDSKNAKPRTLRFDRGWNLLATRSPDGSGRDYAPALQYYDFPLFPGKTWQQTTTETNIQTGAVRTHTVYGSVESWETVSVPAGTFRAIRVSLRTELFDPRSGEQITGTDVSWYVPEVRRSVKSLTTGGGDSQRLIQLLRYELGE